MSDKERVVADLIASSTTEGVKKTVLIEELGSEKKDSSSCSEEKHEESSQAPNVLPVENEGPSLMEQMMLAQQQAKKESDLLKARARAKENKKSLGGGFKKGFLGGDRKSKREKVSVKENSKDDIVTISPKQPATYKGKKNEGGIILDDVQKAMKEEEERNPLLKQLKTGEWATDDLISKMQSHPVLSRGLQSPKCQAALQLMQTDPQAAKNKYGHDPEVAAFIQAFSSLMAEHFTQLGEAQTQQMQSTTIPEGQVEIGPLHADALTRQNEKSKDNSGIITEVHKEEDARVKEIIEDEELRNMLMDVQLQRVLQECSDPALFQKHMQDPVTAYKIKKLYDAGLVGTAK